MRGDKGTSKAHLLKDQDPCLLGPSTDPGRGCCSNAPPPAGAALPPPTPSRASRSPPASSPVTPFLTPSLGLPRGTVTHAALLSGYPQLTKHFHLAFRRSVGERGSDSSVSTLCPSPSLSLSQSEVGMTLAETLSHAWFLRSPCQALFPQRAGARPTFVPPLMLSPRGHSSSLKRLSSACPLRPT